MKKNILAAIAMMACCISIESMSQNTTKVIAHRGAWKNTGATENSIAALEEAIKLGCYGSEFDVHMSADSVLFINHDHVIQGIDIEKTTSQDLANVKLKNGESLPTLEAYLKAGSKQTKTRLILEVKSSMMGKERSFTLAKKCVEMVKKFNLEAITDYIAFDFDVCTKLKEYAPNAHIEYLNGDKTPEQIQAAGLGGIDYYFSVYRKNPAYFQEMRDKNLKTNVWTVNDEPTMKWLLENKVDYITTNEPEKLLELTK
jgi:glycerophosphoryl diester phosphodiesterase